MEKKTTEPTSESRATWDGLEALMRQMIQSWLQDLLEEEVSELPGGRPASARRPSRLLPRQRGGVTQVAFRSRRRVVSRGTRRAAAASARRPWPRGLA